MNNLIRFLKKFDNIFVFLILGISFFFYCFNFKINPIDELWNFQNIYKMYNGFQIYNDCNVIITPLFFVIGEFIFKIFSPNVITLRIYNLLIFCFLYTLMYILFKTLKLSKTKSLLFTCLIFAFLLNVISGGANYNTLSIVFIILGMIFLIKSRENNIYLFFNGIAIYLAIFTKQNIGAYYLGSVCICELILNKNLFITIKRLLLELIPTAILSIISLLIMHNYGILSGFIDYAVLGMSEFSIKNIYIDWSVFFIFLFIFIVYIFSIYIIKNNKCDKKVSDNIVILLSVSILICLTMYPIFNFYHAKIVLIFVIILFLYVIDKIALTPLLDVKIYNKLAIIVSLFIISLIFLYTVSIAFINRRFYYHYDKSHPYYYCYVSDENKVKIESINKYIESKNLEGTDVIIFSDQAALYMVPLKQSHGYFDLPLVRKFWKSWRRWCY